MLAALQNNAEKVQAADVEKQHNENNNYTVRSGEIFMDKYEIRSLLGRGSFGKVFKAYDRQNNCFVAIKMMKNTPSFLEYANAEIKLLCTLNRLDIDNKYAVRLKSAFNIHNHPCLVFELLSSSLFDLIAVSQFEGVCLSLTRRIGKQLLEALLFFASPELGLIHCDLKPENILFSTDNLATIKVIDFGSSCRIGQRMLKYVQSRFYRAPEILLELPYGFPIDMWSVGCILAELHTGEPLFKGIDEFDQMNRMIEVLGIPPKHLLDFGNKTAKYFDKNVIGSYVLKQADDARKYEAPGRKSLHNILSNYIAGFAGQRNSKSGTFITRIHKFRGVIG